MLRQFCNSVLIENNEVTPEWVATHSRVSLLFPMRTESLASLHAAALMLTLSVNEPLSACNLFQLALYIAKC